MLKHKSKYSCESAIYFYFGLDIIKYYQNFISGHINSNYIICKHVKLKSLVTSLAFQQIRGAGTNQEHVSTMQDIECTCKTKWYTIVTLGLVILGIMIFIVINARKLKLFRGHPFSNTVKVMLFISDAQYYIPVKLGRAAGSIHLFKITGKVAPEHSE